MSTEPSPPLVSTRAELRNLRNHSQATVEELKTFLSELKGRSPQEMLGMVSGNQLIRATTHALIFTAGIIVVFTAIPYFTREAPAESAAATVTEVPVPAEETSEPTVVEEAVAPPPDALDELGIGEEKQAPPDVNPLDGKTGGFLDELE